VKKFYDIKTLTGQGHLTNAAVDLLQKYYGLAVRMNWGNFEHVRKAVWVTFFHKASADSSSH
jgi:hypothetical protein